MSKEAIVERILSDAAAECDAIKKEAEKKAAEYYAEANERAEKGRRQTELETEERRKSISEKKAAAARLEGAKILLSEKRRVMDFVYAEALKKLQSLGKEDCLALTCRLLTDYAEEGDEVFFAQNYPYMADAALLPVAEAKKLHFSSERLPLDGGMFLKGVRSDKDLSYGALLAADREEFQSEIAAELFKNKN